MKKIVVNIGLAMFMLSIFSQWTWDTLLDKAYLQEKKVNISPNIFEYDVMPIEDQSISLDGKNTDAAWNVAGSIRSFINPWDTICICTFLSMVYDTHFLYFFFDVKDNEIVLISDFSGERDIELEDRVELFFSIDPDMQD